MPSVWRMHLQLVGFMDDILAQEQDAQVLGMPAVRGQKPREAFTCRTLVYWITQNFVF